MATQVSPKPAGKHDAFISAQLARAEQRIRLVDLATGLAGFVVGTLLYAIAMIVLDRIFVLSAGTRQILLLFYVVASGVYLYLAVLRPLRWRVNPLYAARQLEQTLPGQRSHLVNWIDLRDEKLPAAFRTSLGQRTAKDLAKTDVDEAISNRRAWVATAGVGMAGVGLVVLILLFGPGPFSSLLARAFAPFGRGIATPTRTQITLVRPESGDLVVTIGKPVTVVVQIDGRVPSARDRDAACLLYRQDESEPYRKRYLQFDESGRDWVASIGPADVGNGFIYKVTAGDAETLEYRVTTRAAPLIGDFLATYHYRPYVGKADRARTARKLDDLRGTEVHILARANRVLKDARLDFEATGGGGDIVRGELRADDPRAMRFRIVLDRPGKYRLRFTSAEAEGETYIDPTGNDIVVQPDLPPVVRITQPDKDIQVPANGHVELRGDVNDDIGIAAVLLRMRIVDGPVLPSVPFLADRLGKPDFGTPRQLDYRELIELPRLPVKAGMTIEYWLEARDGCDFPKANVSESTPKRRIIVIAAKDDVAEQKSRDKARQEKADHEKKQQEELKKQKAAQEKERKQDEADERADAKKREQDRQGKGKEENSTKPEPNKEPSPEEKKTEQKADEIKKEIDKQQGKQEKENAKAGEGKGPGKEKNDEPKPGQGKEPGQEKGKKDDKPGAGRDEGKKDDKKGAGEKKDAGKGDDKPGEGRGEGKPKPDEPKGESKKAGPEKPGNKPGESKPDKAKPSQGQDKGPGKDKDGAKPGESKSEGDKPMTDKNPQGEAKDSKAARDPKKGDNCPCQGKPGAGDKGKPGGKGSAKPAADKSGKEGKAGEGKPPAGGKPGTGKGGPPDQQNAPGAARGEGGPKGDPKPEDATAQDAKKRADDSASGDEDARQAAAKDLKEMAEQAKDDKARQAAREGLDKARDGFEKPNAGAKPPDAPPMPAKPDDAGGKDVEQLKKMAQGSNSQGRAWARGQLGEIAKQAKDEQARKAAREALDQAWRDWLNQGDKKQRTREKPGRHRPSALQLEEFRKKVDPNVLKEMKMSKEQFEQFLHDYAELAKRQPARDDDEEKLPGVGRSKGHLPGSSGATIRPGKGSDDLGGSGRAKPPPEYRDAYNDFLKNLRR